jgi:hypothetical protein
MIRKRRKSNINVSLTGSPRHYHERTPIGAPRRDDAAELPPPANDIPPKEFRIPHKMVYEDAPAVRESHKSTLRIVIAVFAFGAAVLSIIYSILQKRRARRAAQADEPLLDREGSY